MLETTVPRPGALVRGIIATGTHLPHRRLERAAVAAFFGKGGGSGARTVASFDEDTTSMGAEAARAAVASAPDVGIAALWFATASPAYLEKTNASAIHATLRLDASVPAFDFGGAHRSGIGALCTALGAGSTTLVVASDSRDGLATSADESQGGDGAAALVIGDDTAGPVIAEFIGGASVTDEFLERWRVPGGDRSRTWEDRFGEVAYAPLMEQAWTAALANTALAVDDIDTLVVAGTHARAVARNVRKLGVDAERIGDDLSGTVGNTGAAHPLLVLATAVEAAGPGETIALMALADGVDVLIVRTTDAVASYRAARPVATQIEGGAPIDYATFLSWRGMVAIEPPNRPLPNRPSAAAAHRRDNWKFGFVGSRDRSSGMVHLPPARVSERGGAVDDMDEVPMADVRGTVVSFTVDKLVYSPSPPVVFAVVDFDGGGRAPLELTDVDADEVVVGMRVEPTFRRLFTADEIHNYFWKVRPVREARV